MIESLNPSRLEAGIEAYLVALHAAAVPAVTVPSATGEAAVTRIAPPVIPAISLKIQGIASPCVAVLTTECKPECTGLYTVSIDLAVTTPLLVPGITLEDHRALYDAVASVFPNRPATGGADLTAWLALEAALSAAVVAACGYEIHGWFAGDSVWSKAENLVTQPYRVRLSVNHPSV